jgi:ABC-type polysaccharide/polyol phosphate transport system ATPase subunit
MTASMQPAVYVDRISKTFRIPHEHVHTLKEKALHPFRRTGYDVLRALRDLSFEVQRGEFFGIVGRNGSGKSTLLKCLAGIYRVDSGAIHVNGRVSTFIELGVGFNPDLAAYDNVMLNATMLGLSTREARKRFDRVMDFAELAEFADLKLKNYSSGMLVRLAFSVMIQVDADILLIDEVLAVGDAAFQQKCYDEFGRIRRSGATVLLVTHEMSAVQRFCDRALLLERGRKSDVGDTERVADRYLQLNFSETARAAEADDATAAELVPAPVAFEEEPGSGLDEHGSEPFRSGNRAAEILDAWFEDADGIRTDVLRVAERCVFAARVRFHAPIDDPLFGMILYNSLGDIVLAANNRYEDPPGSFYAGHEIVYRIAFDNVLAPDRYWITAGVANDQHSLEWHDRRHRMFSVVVTGTRPADGLLSLPYDFAIETVAPTEVPG